MVDCGGFERIWRDVGKCKKVVLKKKSKEKEGFEKKVKKGFQLFRGFVEEIK